MYLEIFHYWTVMTEAVRPGVDQSSTTVVLVLLLPLLLHDHYESQPGPRSEHSEISRPVSGLSSYSLVHPAPHQPVVVVKVSDVRQHRLVIDVVVVVPRTVVTPGLLPPPLASLRLEALFGRLLGISDGEKRLGCVYLLHSNRLDTRDRVTLDWLLYDLEPQTQTCHTRSPQSQSLDERNTNLANIITKLQKLIPLISSAGLR